MSDRPRLAWYGDDFTGSTDVMEALARAGVRAALFLDPPTPARLASGRFVGLEAVGVAGTSRTMGPEAMDAALPPIFAGLGALNPTLVHYKVCSTFDSSPAIGSIGRALDLGQGVFASPYVPLVVGAPILRRYCVFGNLFASVAGETHRLDRHPTMRLHPVTPMDESDLRLHLGRQTARPIGLLDVLGLSGPPEDVSARLDRVLAGGAEVVLFDVLGEADLAAVGRLVWERASASARPQFAVGSSGLEYALAAHWRASGELGPPAAFPDPGPADRLLIVSGSCSPATREQVERALAAGFEGVLIDAARMAGPEAGDERASAVERARRALDRGRSVVVYSALGPDDPRIAGTLERLARAGLDPQRGRDRLGEGFGAILRELVGSAGVRRVAVAGGDTSGHAARGLGIEALEVVAPTAPGSPLCRATAPDPAVDGLQIVLKGGQVGGPDYFLQVLRGAFG